jgi:hypothetical protein
MSSVKDLPRFEFDPRNLRLLASHNEREPLAQSVEHLTFNQVVGSSSLPRLTNRNKGLDTKSDPFSYARLAIVDAV